MAPALAMGSISVRPPARALSVAATHGVALGSMPAATRIDVYVSLPGRHTGELDRFIAAVNASGSRIFGHFLTPQAFGEYFGADPVTYGRAVAALRSAGFTIDALLPNRTDIEAHAPAAVASAFFQTPIDLRNENGRAFFANRYVPVLPAIMTGAAVSGLDNYVRFHSMLERSPNAVIGGYFSWGPADVAAAYDLNPLYKSGLDGTGVTIANATLGPATNSDLALFQKHFHIKGGTLVSTPVPVNQPAGSYDIGESTLDVDVALSVARGATFNQVLARSPYNHAFDLVYGYIVNNLGKTVHIVTTSWGVCEHEMQGTPSVSIDEKLFVQAAAEGQFWFAASGDDGSDDCDSAHWHQASVDFPGSSPYVTDVGGTAVTGKRVKGAITAWQSEVAWGGSGGGKSILYAKPAYQKALSPKDGVRDVPDVALIAAPPPADGMWIAIEGQLQGGWAGTSEAAPQWAALLAIVAQRQGGAPKIDPHVRLYQLAAMPAYASVMHDITQGNNTYDNIPGFNAGPGYDLVSGLGSYIGAALVNAY